MSYGKTNLWFMVQMGWKMVFVDTILVLATSFAGIEFYYLHSPSQCHTKIRKQHQQFTLLRHIWKPFWLHDITYIMILWYQRNSDFMISMDCWFHDIKEIIVLWHKHLFEKNKKIMQNRNYKFTIVIWFLVSIEQYERELHCLYVLKVP